MHHIRKTSLQCRKIDFKNFGLGYEDVAPAFQRLRIVAKQRSEHPLGTVASDRFADFATRYEANLCMGVFEKKKNEKRRMKRFAVFVDLLELSMGLESLQPPYTANLFLPLARLALITLRPFLVFILARNPCVRLRMVLCGW